MTDELEEEQQQIPDMVDTVEAGGDNAAFESEADTPRQDADVEADTIAEEFSQVQVEEQTSSPVHVPSDLVMEEEPLVFNEAPATSPLASSAGEAWKAESQNRIDEKMKEESAKKRELIQKGQQELEAMMQEAKEQSLKRRAAALEESKKSEKESLSLLSSPGMERSRGESWSLVCDLIDFKRDTKADLAKFKSLMIQLKHA